MKGWVRVAGMSTACHQLGQHGRPGAQALAQESFLLCVLLLLRDEFCSWWDHGGERDNTKTRGKTILDGWTMASVTHVKHAINVPRSFRSISSSCRRTVMDCSFSSRAFSLLRSSSSFFASLAGWVSLGGGERDYDVCRLRGAAAYLSLMSSSSLMRPRRLTGFFTASVPSVTLTGAGGFTGVTVVVVPCTFPPGLSEPYTTCGASGGITSVLLSVSKAWAFVPFAPFVPGVPREETVSASAVPAHRPSTSVAATATSFSIRLCVCVTGDRDPIADECTERAGLFNVGQCLGAARVTVVTCMPACIVRRVDGDARMTNETTECLTNYTRKSKACSAKNSAVEGR